MYKNETAGPEVNGLKVEEDLAQAWKFEPELVVCEACDWGFLLPKETLPQTCPNCFRATLSAVDASSIQWAALRPPEQYLPFTVSGGDLVGAIEKFQRGIWFAPTDLTAQNLAARLKRIFLPVWLVDLGVRASWQAEAGFNYQVVSHQDRYDQNRGGWTSEEVTEGRVRWESRLGSLEREYHNLPAPALEENTQLQNDLGSFDLQKAQTYQSEAVRQSFIRLPNRAPHDAWTDALPSVQRQAAEECKQAAEADAIRSYQWSPEFCKQNWTLLLLPAFTSYYRDDQGQPQRLLVNGQTGKVSGVRRASVKRGNVAALTILGIAGVIFILSLALAAASVLAPPLLVVGGVGIVLAVLVALAALIPVFMVWSFNRNRADHA